MCEINNQDEVFEKELKESYESPIRIIVSEMRTQMEGQILKAVKDVGVVVDKEELLKALEYDRDQYSRGYEQGREVAIAEVRHIIHEIYMGNLYCIEDECGHEDGRRECDDCLYSIIEKNLERLKEQKHDD